MEPVTVSAKETDKEKLFNECQRLGITVPTTSAVSTLRKKLRGYSQKRTTWLRYCELASLLFGDSHNINTRTIDDIMDDVTDLLYQRLMREGFVAVGVEDGEGLYDERSTDTIYILARAGHTVNTRRVSADGSSTTNSSCAIMYVARLAFKDVNDTYLAWEQTGRAKRKGQTPS